ncbi:MAG: DUF2905 domain-containing protein [Actinomycetota bacterium]
MDSRSIGWVLVGLGVAMVVIGLIATTGALGWFGRLPGDLRFRTGNTRVFIPITSMLLLSIALSVVLALIRRFF